MKKKLRLGALILVLISFNIVVAKSAALSEESITLAFDEVEETENLTYDKETNDVYVTEDLERLTVTKNELEEKPAEIESKFEGDSNDLAVEGVSTLNEEKGGESEDLKTQDDTSSKRYYDVPLSKDEQDYIYDCSERFSIPVQLILAVIEVESKFDPNCRSATKDSGLMQINDCNKKFLSDNYDINDLFDPYQNILAGCIFLSRAGAADTQLNQVLMIYNMGYSRAEKAWKSGVYSTKYTKEVLEIYEYYNSL